MSIESSAEFRLEPHAAAPTAYIPTHSTIPGQPLAEPELRRIDTWWRAANYLSLGMIYLRDNPLLAEPLRPDHIKNRQLGHWGSSPGLAFLYTHLNRLLCATDRYPGLEMIFLAGPGHGAPGVLGPLYLEGSYSHIYPDKGQDIPGLLAFFRQFSFPGGIGSHCTPETPGSIHEGGELGYVLSHACGAAFDHPRLVVAAVVGDGEAETAALATSWHINKFLHPVRDGAVLPILHLNGYKINNPSLLSRIPREDLESLLRGYGWAPCFVEGSDPDSMHQAMAATMDHCMDRIRVLQSAARGGARAAAPPRWPMIVLRSPKGWTAPRQIDGHFLEGFWRAHQVPIGDVKSNPAHLRMLEDWMRSLQPVEFFTSEGKLASWFAGLAPRGQRRMGLHPATNGGAGIPLRLPDFTSYALRLKGPAVARAENTRPLGAMLRDTLRLNPDSFRLFGPDETTSNKLDAAYEVTGKFWNQARLPEDDDGGYLDPSGRVLEMLSEHTLEGMLEGYLLTGRHGFFSTYESFVHVIDSMFNQHAKWLEIASRLDWRRPVASLNLLITSTVWRQDHNGFTHQDPGFLDLVVNKSAGVTRIYLPPDVNSLLSVADHCLRSRNYINVIVSDKQNHLQYMDMDSAIRHCTKGIGIWDWASNDRDHEPDLVIASAGDIPTLEALAATALLRQHFPDLRIRFVNVVDLFRLQPESEHPHGLSDTEFDSLFTTSKPILFNFHGYPWLIHRLAYRRRNHANLHVRGYKEQGSINTPLELAIRNNIDRFSLAIDAIDRVPGLRAIGAHAREAFLDRQIACSQYAFRNGIDDPAESNWTWPL